MIYITGDTHGMIDWEKINTREFPEQKSLTRDDYVIVLGDFGGIWDGAEQDRHILKTYGQRKAYHLESQSLIIPTLKPCGSIFCPI